MVKPDAKATLLFVHGYGEHCGRYEHVLRWFHDKGYNVATFDYRGHGRSSGRRGHVNRYSEYIGDMDAFLRKAMADNAGDQKMYIVGHSNGGLVVANYILEQPEGIDGVILSSPMLGFKLKIPAWKSILGRVMSRVWPTLSLPSEIPPSHLTHDSEVCEAYSQDPLVHSGATARWFTEASQAQEYVLSNADRIHLPILVMQAGDDQIVDADKAQDFVAAVGASDKELKWYDGLYHELFNELRNEEVFGHIHEWVQQH